MFFRGHKHDSRSAGCLNKQLFAKKQYHLIVDNMLLYKCFHCLQINKSIWFDSAFNADPRSQVTCTSAYVCSRLYGYVLLDVCDLHRRHACLSDEMH